LPAGRRARAYRPSVVPTTSDRRYPETTRGLRATSSKLSFVSNSMTPPSAACLTFVIERG
ncbi:MAG TPA: hypothetical protein VFX96_13880, partial [Pyrinomonadaceae bacterium]|nr:hypothetical protein [Pyrinomonadaceae bacterium]